MNIAELNAWADQAQEHRSMRARETARRRQPAPPVAVETAFRQILAEMEGLEKALASEIDRVIDRLDDTLVAMAAALDTGPGPTEEAAND